MAVIAVVNRKGGSGKSTVATHIAAWLARQGLPVMLGDVDRQQSARLWLSLRGPELPSIAGWTIDERNFARPPAGVKHVVLDTPGGFQGVGLMKVAMYADAIIVPTASGLFDRQAAQETLAELRAYPRIALGKCRLATLAVRIDPRTRNAQLVADWAREQGVEHLGSLRAVQAYPRGLESGLTVFEQPADEVAHLQDEWQPVVDWLRPVLERAAEPAGELARPGVLARAMAERAAQRAQQQGASAQGSLGDAASRLVSAATPSAQSAVQPGSVQQPASTPLRAPLSGAPPLRTAAAAGGEARAGGTSVSVPRFLQLG
jgi:chromosome partitioning protein